MTQIMVEVDDVTITRIQSRCGAEKGAKFASYAGGLLDEVVYPGATIIGIDPGVLRVYQSESVKRDIDGGATELIEALLADWPAILAPVQPKGAVVDGQDFPSGSAF